MVLCLIALPVFAVLSIFSVKYRKLTLDALECLFKTVSLRKCESGLDDRIKADLTGKVMKLSPKTARFFYRNYKWISFVILALFLWSLVVGSIGAYNYVKYGNCNGPESTGFCIFDPTGQYSGTSSCSNITDIDQQKERVYPTVREGDLILGPSDAKLTIIEFGCFVCHYTKEAEPTMAKILSKYPDVRIIFKTVYLPTHEFGKEADMAAYCSQEQGYFATYKDALFANQDNMTATTPHELAVQLGLNVTMFDECMGSERYNDKVQQDTLDAAHAQVLGTPTFFINKEVIIGPKPLRTFETIIDKELKAIR